MAKESKRRYAINFDLSIKQLTEFYDAKNPKKAYSDIKRFMNKNGFVHRQWSGYISEKTMTKPELWQFTLNLHKEFPWLIDCEGSMDATVITDIFDIKQMVIDTMLEDDDLDISL